MSGSGRAGWKRLDPGQRGAVAIAVVNALACGVLGFAGAVITRLPVVAVLGYLFAVACVGLAVLLVLLPQYRRRLSRLAVYALVPGIALLFAGVLTPPATPDHVTGCGPTATAPLCPSGSTR
jgi:hypothetical protein